MLIQKFHPGLQFSRYPTLARSGKRLFSRQGDWDGGSTLHCVAMALALLGKLTAPALLPYCGSGTEATLWDAAWPHYLHGLTISELASFIAELNVGVRPVTHAGMNPNMLEFGARQLAAGYPVIVGWRQSRPVRWRAALAIGIEGRQANRLFTPQALLLLDPAGAEPHLVGFNARLDRLPQERMRYQSATVQREVTFEGAVSIRPLTSAGAFA